MLKRYLICFVLCIIYPVGSNADFLGLPKLPYFGKLQSYNDAIKMLFNYPLQEIHEIKTSGGEVKEIFIVISANKKWFVKILEENSSKTKHFENEWKLKKDREKYSWLSSKNAELVFPEKGATFIFGKRKHLIISYPWVPGKNLSAIYIKYFDEKIRKESLKKAFFRYGQVLSVAHFDPDQPAQNIDELLNRQPRLYLNDRNGENEIYDEYKDRIYIVDLADDSENIGRNVLVKEEVEYWLKSMIDLYDKLEEPKKSCGNNYECLLIPFHSFSQGYISSLPMYNDNLLMSMLREKYFEIVEDGCEKEGIPELCLFKDQLSAEWQLTS